MLATLHEQDSLIAGKEGSPLTRVAKSQAAASTADVRARIINAALEDFALLGFEGARMQGIAKRAGVGHPLLHYYFGDKSALWKAAVLHAFAPLHEAYNADLDDLAGRPPLAVLKARMRRFILFCARYPLVGILVNRESMLAGPRLTWLATTVIAPLHQNISTVLRSAIDSGEIKNLPEVNLIQSMIGAVVQFYCTGPLLRELYTIDPLDHECIEEHADLLMDVLIDGIKRR